MFFAPHKGVLFYKKGNQMTKNQKLLFWVGAVCFAVPEVLFGSIIKIFGLSFVPIYKDVQLFTDHPSWAMVVIIVEILGILACVYTFYYGSIARPYRYILVAFFGIILLLLLLSLYITYAVAHISF